MNRRGFIGSLLAAPAIVRAEILMPVKQVWQPERIYMNGMRFVYGKNGLLAFDMTQLDEFPWRNHE